MLVPILLFALGLVLLIKGGDWFVDGATGLARRFRIPEIIVGATVVSIGTTLPEVMVSATGALEGLGSMAYGNAIGSVICNTSLIAAITLAVRPGTVDRKSLRMPVLFFFGAAALYCGTAYLTGYFSRPLGFVLLAIFSIGAPGVPGGTVMASLGIVTSVLGLGADGTALLLAIFAIQDSFGTACNVTGDGALTLILTGYAEKHNVKEEKIEVAL